LWSNGGDDDGGGGDDGNPYMIRFQRNLKHGSYIASRHRPPEQGGRQHFAERDLQTQSDQRRVASSSLAGALSDSPDLSRETG